jgi:hypothetical protein
MSETTTANPTTAKWVTDGIVLLNAQIEEANKLAGIGERVANATKVMTDLRDDDKTDDPKIKAYQNKLNKANNEILKWQSEIENYIRTEKLGTEDVSPEDVEKASIQYKAIADTVKNTEKILITLNNGSALDGIAELKSFPGTRKATSGSTGVKRPRFKSVRYRVAGSNEWLTAETDKRDANGKLTGEKSSSLTALALAVNKVEGTKLGASDFHTPLFDVVGVNTDLTTLADKEITFALLVGTGESAKNYEVQVIPQSA